MTTANVALGAPVGIEARGPVLGTLESVCNVRGLPDVEARIAELRAFLEEDLAGIERDLQALEERPTPMHASARHLVKSGGKRLRPLCVALAARVGTGFDERARDLAVASELVHSATLLHDDVVDVGDKRRGEPAARVLYGNAASIFAGDWLLVEALMRVRRTGLPDVLERALGVLAEMLEGEALQLARRGKVDATSDDYFRVVRAKTASLFKWAMFAGARAGGLDPAAGEALELFGAKLGVAFQVVDDVLDVDGDTELVGKDLFADLREGKITYPLILALDRVGGLREELAASLADAEATLSPELARRTAQAMIDSGACQDARAFAERLTGEAVAALEVLPDRPSVRALAGVAARVAARRN